MGVRPFFTPNRIIRLLIDLDIPQPGWLKSADIARWSDVTTINVSDNQDTIALISITSPPQPYRCKPFHE